MVRQKFSLKKLWRVPRGSVNFVSERKVSMPRHWFFFFDLKKTFLDDPNKQYTDVSSDVTVAATSRATSRLAGLLVHYRAHTFCVT